MRFKNSRGRSMRVNLEKWITTGLSILVLTAATIVEVLLIRMLWRVIG